VDKKLLDPASASAVSVLLGACSGGYLGARDKAAILFLCDTGCRASEVTGLNVTDYDGSSGAVIIRNGKGGKGRTVFVGRKTRRALRRYLRQRPADTDPALWVTVGGDTGSLFRVCGKSFVGVQTRLVFNRLRHTASDVCLQFNALGTAWTCAGYRN